MLAVVQRLLEAGVQPGQCGVICFFRSQVLNLSSVAAPGCLCQLWAGGLERGRVS